MKTKATAFIPFEQVDAHGDVLSKDCKFTFEPRVKILESHRGEDRLRIVTEMQVDEVSVVPKTFGFNVF